MDLDGPSPDALDHDGQQHDNDKDNATRAKAPSLNKACEPCRALKVRCLPATGGSNPVCQRCLKHDRVCVYAQPHRKKPRKRHTDARVAELEKEVIAMRALLEKTSRPGFSSALPEESPPGVVQAPRAASTPGYDTTGLVQTTYTDDANHQPKPRDPDIIDRGVITNGEARRLLDIYRVELVPHYPLVIIPADRTVEQLRRDEPLVFHAIICAASSNARPELYGKLNAEIIETFVRKVMIEGEKTLEMVRAISIASAWYYPADRFSSLKYYEYSHLSATVAVNLGLGDRSVIEEIEDEFVRHDSKIAILACYMQCAKLSLVRRFPNMLRFSPYMSELTQGLDVKSVVSSPEAILAAYLRLVNIGEEISSVMGLCDQGATTRMQEVVLQQNIVSYTRKLRIWKDHYKPEALSPVLMVMHHHLMIVLHEAPLHRFYPPAFFPPPIFLTGPKLDGADLTQVEMQALSVTSSSARSLLDVFLSNDNDWLRTLPAYQYSRATFALSVLVATALLPPPSSSILDAATHLEFNRETTQVDGYLDAVIDKFLQAAGMMVYRVPTVFVGPLIRLRKWWRWAAQRIRQDQTADGGFARFSVFAGPDNHPALGASSSPSPQRQGDSNDSSPLAGLEDPHLVNPEDFAAASPVTSSKIMPNSFVQEPRAVSTMISGKNGIIDVDWMDDLQQDLSSLIDPSLFPYDFEYGDMANAFDSLGSPGISLDPQTQPPAVSAGDQTYQESQDLGLSDSAGFVTLGQLQMSSWDGAER